MNNAPLRICASVLDVSTVVSPRPIHKKIIGNCELLSNDNTIVGYSKCFTESVLGKDTKPFLYLKKEKTEGAVYNNVIGTYITSPIFAQNPYFCDYIIANCLKTRYKCAIPLAKLCDDIECYSHNYFLEAK